MESFNVLKSKTVANASSIFSGYADCSAFSIYTKYAKGKHEWTYSGNYSVAWAADN